MSLWSSRGRWLKLRAVPSSRVCRPCLEQLEERCVPSVTLTTTANPSSVTLGTAAVVLQDTATLSGAQPTPPANGTITFTLHLGSTLLDTETIKVTGNNSYTTPKGYTIPSSGNLTGTYQWDATYAGDTNTSNGTASSTSEPVIVGPTLTNTAGAAVVLGSGTKLTDSATLVSGSNATGYILFTLKAPSGSTVDQEIVNVTGNSTYTTPNGYTPTTTGTYQWVASYSGDATHGALTSPVATEKVSAATTPTLTTTPGGSVVLTNNTPPRLTDSATLRGGLSPSGTITFYLFAPGATPSTMGSGSVYSSSVTVNGNRTYGIAGGTTTGNAVPTQAGAYQWVVVYSGDNNNNGITSTTVTETVTAASPKLANTPGNAAPVGNGMMSDTATLSGGFNPSGFILFTLTSPSGAIVYTEVATVSANATQFLTGNGNSNNITGSAVPTQFGIYKWVATYSGDANNKAVTTLAVNEAATIGNAPTPTVNVRAGSAIVLGSRIALSASATLVGGSSPTGTITFYLFAPGVTPNTSGAGSVYSSTVMVNGNRANSKFGVKTTGSAMPTQAGTYHWVAVYSGDVNNNSVGSSESADELVSAVPPGSRWGRG
jgi:hypothetical protein